MDREFEVEKEIWWRKTGGGSHRMKKNGKLMIIKPGQKFKARPSEIPEAFRDIILPLENIPKEPPLKVDEPTYEIVHKGSGWYNVVDGDGKIMNEKAMRPEEAEELVRNLKSA